MWRARVVEVSSRGVFVSIPALDTRGGFGPCQWVGERPTVGTSVLVCAVDGDESDVIIVGVLGA